MIDFINGVDQQIVLWVNGWNTPFFDQIMWLLSDKIIWIPFYIFLLFILFRAFGWKKGMISLLFLLLAIGLTDFVCSGLFKTFFERFRPSHEAALDGLLHFHQFEDGSFYKGGKYGFVSSHAGNFLCLATFLSLTFRSLSQSWPWVLFSIAVLVSFSRIYLAVHYLTDVLVGGLIGVLVGYLFYRFSLKFTQKI